MSKAVSIASALLLILMSASVMACPYVTSYDANRGLMELTLRDSYNLEKGAEKSIDGYQVCYLLTNGTWLNKTIKTGTILTRNNPTYIVGAPKNVDIVVVYSAGNVKDKQEIFVAADIPAGELTFNEKWVANDKGERMHPIDWNRFNTLKGALEEIDKRFDFYRSSEN